MKRMRVLRHQAVAAGIALVLCLSACPSGEESGGGGGGEEVTPPPTDPNKSKKLNVNGQQVVMEAWGEPEEDPRCLLGYELEGGDGSSVEGGTPFWDRYVILYGGRVSNKNCANEPGTTCQKTGLHLHLFDAAVEHLYNDAETKLRPLQEKGIKVLMGLVPDTSGVAVGSLYNWPNEEYYPWAENNNGQPYPFGEAEARAFVQDVAAELKKYRLDGVGYDEEYANLAGGTGPGLPNVYPTTVEYNATSAQVENAWKKGGENLFRFAYELQQAMPYAISQDIYEIRFGTHVPETMPMYKLDPSNYTEGTTEGDKTVAITDVFDYSFHSIYGQLKPTSANPMPRSRYGCISVSIADVETAPQPAMTPSGIDAAMETHLAGDYGMIMYYCFRSRFETTTRWPNMYGAGKTVEEYYSRISEPLFGCATQYVGEDYPRMYGWP
ncbi:MAG: hypothetical protein LBG87_01785 [Spirochaetaceae bacterium]|jgi:hypothetical protein|nr:hypothetical protein [Spirochaetaceae bacterium]